jgi:hypothetical protein
MGTCLDVPTQRIRAGEHDVQVLFSPRAASVSRGTIVADGDGYVMCRKFRAATEQGEVVMVIAAEVG